MIRNSDARLECQERKGDAGKAKKIVLKLLSVLLASSSKLGGSEIVPVFERTVKMRPVLKTADHTNFVDTHAGCLQ